MNKIDFGRIVDTAPHTSTLEIPEGTIIHYVGFNKNVPKWRYKAFKFLDKIIKLLTKIQRKL